MRYLLLALLLIGCDNPFGVDVPAGAVETEPGYFFEDAWAVAEKDAGVQGDFDRVRWFEVEGGPWDPGDGTTARGQWVKSGNRIFIADAFWHESSVVIHEILHALLQDPSHDHPLFSTQKYNYAPIR